LGIESDPVAGGHRHLFAQPGGSPPDQFGVARSEIVDEEPFVPGLHAVRDDRVVSHCVDLARGDVEAAFSQEAEIVGQHSLVVVQLSSRHHRQALAHDRTIDPVGSENRRDLAVVDDGERFRRGAIERRGHRGLHAFEHFSVDHPNTVRTIEMISSASSSLVMRGGRN
jgi:hypothetical protein